jgi:hypothetical protein
LAFEQKPRASRLAAAAALFLIVATAALGLARPAAAATPVDHRVDLYQGNTPVLTILQRSVKGTNGYTVSIYAIGAKTGTKLAATLNADGTLDFAASANDPAWWSNLLAANGGSGKVVPSFHTLSGRALLDLAVVGGGASHLLTTAYADPDDPWGPCPGPTDAPTCWPDPVIITDACFPNPVPCVAGKLPWGPSGSLTPASCTHCVPDPLHDPRTCAFCSIDPDGDPAHGRGVVVLDSASAKLSGGVMSLGTTRLWLDQTGRVERLPPQ